MRILATLFLVLGSAGCARAPALVTVPEPVTLPEQFTAASTDAADVRSDWWEDFGTSSLSRAVTAALEHNHDLQAAATRVERSLAEARIAGADLEPAVGGSLGGSRRRQNFVGFPVPGGSGVLSTTSTTLGTSLDVSWEVDLWGRLRASTRAALAEAQAADADYRAAHLSLAGQTVKAWLAVAEATQQMHLARSTAESWRASYEQLRDRYERGVRSALDVRLALSNLAAAEALVATRLRQQDATARQLEIFMGRYPGRTDPPPETLPPVPAGIPGGLPAELVARRPDLVAAERRLAAADQRVRASRRSLYPRLSLTTAGGTVSDQLADLVDGDFRVWSFVGNILQPVFQGGRLRAGVDRAEAASVEAAESYAASALRAYGEVETALAADQHLAREEERLAESSRQAAAARDLAESRYRSGLEDYVTVLESQRRSLTSESAYLALRRTRLDNRVNLYLALGGGFQRPDPVAAAGGNSRAMVSHAEPAGHKP